jgi:hypothetical protein
MGREKMSDIPEPVRPTEPVYEDVKAQPDEAHDWYWPGNTDNDFCRKCDKMNCDCGSGTCGGYATNDLGCARNRAWNRNWDREHEYKKAMERWP